ncbi:efflux RND transporter permease subunit [Pseudarthrobacter raffinosi]|uniref:efflux RND transporter permease subunit n=1 Tax=Pseudarthrobacter raffinosi TaxID=2953651 RepID=UPI00208EF9D7|nr:MULTISPECIES: efflux RND transporter permease subunit [unclassified Pseudarthrobacter]MCO4251799.1 efflux RND transporter permease subunit [Pseudarthrobacter sp. MDT3-9]MCO4261756.1 efflux RND transporter permease subunit [Pseudarthrobacter sp. MDT3-26]
MFRLAQLSLANRALIALITVFATVFGVITMSSLKQELIPSIEFPQITVLSAMSGASPEVVDKQVSAPLETALNGVEGLESTSSTSRNGVSQISMVFTYGTNLDRARNQIDRAISNAKRSLPEDVQPQAIAGSISDFPIVFLAVSSDKPLSELNADLARLSVPRLQKIDGVRGADVTGGATQHIEILPRPEAMAAKGTTIESIRNALSNNGALIPAGTIQEQGKTLSLQIGSPVDSLDAIKALPVGGAKDAATIGTVADVSLQDDERTSITRTNGQETLAVSVTKKPDGDTVGISHAVNDSLAALEAELGSNAKFTAVFDQAPFIEKSIKDLTTEGLLGLGFAVAVILVFLMSARSTLVTAVSIPLSLLITFIGLSATGYSLNILTLGALTIAIGRVVDDSIVVIENIKRHLSYGEEKVPAILTAIREVAGAITASTLTTVAVFLPIAFVSELAGELFRPFALTVTMALLASLLVSLTIVPVLAYWFLKSPAGSAPAGSPAAGSPAAREAAARATAAARAQAQEAEQKSRLQRAYLPVLSKTQKHPVLTLVAAVLVLGATAAMTPLLSTNLLGDSGQNSLTVRQLMPAGTSLADTSAAAIKVEDVLRGIEGVRNVQLTSGNAQAGFAALTSSGAANSTFTVVTDEKANQAKLQETVRTEVGKVAGSGKITVGTQQGGFGTSSTVDITIKAATSEDLRTASEAMVEAMTGVPATSEVATNLAARQPVVQVKVDRAKTAAAGLNEEQVAGVLAATISPIPAGTVRIDTNDFPVQIGKGTRFTSIDAVRNIALPASGAPVTLGSIASVEQVDVPVSITASNGQRTAKVSVTPSGSNLGAVNAEVQKRLTEVSLPAGVTAELGGATTQQAESFQQLGLALLAAIAIVYVIMVATFKSLIQPLILLVSVPFAATGAVALLLATGVPLGLPSLIGMLMLVGIVVTNAIVLIDLINQYRQPRDGRGGMSVADAITHGARQRLRPILMTALATVFALTPMALGLTGGGGFISQPLAVVVIGGLVSSTTLTLVLVPVLYRLVEGRRETKALLRAMQQRPEFAAADDVDAEFRDWTTGMVPRVSGRRAAPGDPL